MTLLSATAGVDPVSISVLEGWSILIIAERLCLETTPLPTADLQAS